MRYLLSAILIGTLAGGCTRGGDAPAGPAAETPTLDVTSWTDKSELFMEYPPLVAGETIRFAVHLTKLEDFSALNAGRPSIEMTPESGGPPVTLAGSDPLRPGAFRVEGKIPPAGRYRWALLVNAPGLFDRHDLGVTTVFGDKANAIADAEKRPEKDAAAIAYLKEQQWTNPFQTSQVREGEVRSALRVPAAIEPLTGGEAIVAAPADGRYASPTLPSVGDRVMVGQVLGQLEPRLAEGGEDRASLAANVTEAQAALDGAKADQARAERLLQERAVPARRVEDARRATSISEARLTAAQARLAQRDEVLRSGGSVASGNAFVLRAPIAGRVAEVYAALGASFDEGAPLFRIVRTDRVELQAQIPPSEAPLSDRISALALEVPVVSIVAADREGLKAKRLRNHHLRGSSAINYESDIILILNDKYHIVAKVNIEFNPYQAQRYRDWVVASVEKNRGGQDNVDLEYENLFEYSCFDPTGRQTAEKLIEERLYND